jgi:hypothetical protein
VSELNVSEHWTKKHKRTKAQKNAVIFALNGKLSDISLPCDIFFSRKAPRLFDDDNLVASFKHIRDGVVNMLKPGLAPGRGDEGNDIKWHYSQQQAKHYSITIEIRMRDFYGLPK